MAVDYASQKTVPRERARAAAKAKDERVEGTFLAIPHQVLDSAGYRRASHTAKALLIDIASRLRRRGVDDGLPNGGLMANGEFMQERGWTSRSTTNAALKDLVACGLLAVTRQGGLHKPTLLAVTWLRLQVSEPHYRLDIDASKWHSVYMGSYRNPSKPEAAPQGARTAKATAARKAKAAMRGDASRPSDVRGLASTGPWDGQSDRRGGPSDGLVMADSSRLSGPSDGRSQEVHHLVAASASAALMAAAKASRLKALS